MNTPRLETKTVLLLEFGLLFIAMPLVFALLGVESTGALIPILWLASVYGWRVLSKLKATPARDREWEAWRKHGRGIVLRWLLGGALLIGLIAWLTPECLFDAPRNNPGLWLLVLVLYPLLSVIPQEYLYRRFFFARYERLWGSRAITILLSALLFGMAHAVFENWVAVALTLAGGLIFSVTYHRTQSMLCACIEHSLWGDLIFTIGLGEYFVGGTVKALFGLG